MANGTQQIGLQFTRNLSKSFHNRYMLYLYWGGQLRFYHLILSLDPEKSSLLHMWWWNSESSPQLAKPHTAEWGARADKGWKLVDNGIGDGVAAVYGGSRPEVDLAFWIWPILQSPAKLQKSSAFHPNLLYKLTFQSGAFDNLANRNRW